MTPAWFASAMTSARTMATVATTMNNCATTEVAAGPAQRSPLLLVTDASFSSIGETRGHRGRQSSLTARQVLITVQLIKVPRNPTSAL